MRIRELTARRSEAEMSSTRPTASLLDVARLLWQRDVDALPVTDEQRRLVGIISEHDLVGALVRWDGSLFGRMVEDVMIRSLVRSVASTGVMNSTSGPPTGL